jgi:hypothetical protein
MRQIQTLLIDIGNFHAKWQNAGKAPGVYERIIASPSHPGECFT